LTLFTCILVLVLVFSPLVNLWSVNLF
jgi:hypothetical protein